MKQLAFKILLLLTPIVGLYFYGLSLIHPDQIILNKGTAILILGDSHTQCALNDSIMPETMNLSSSADLYFHSYLKLRNILMFNKIRTLVLSYDYTSFWPGIEDQFFYAGNFDFKLKSYESIMNISDIEQVVINKPTSLNHLMGFFFGEARDQEKSALSFSLHGQMNEIDSISRYGGYCSFKKSCDQKVLKNRVDNLKQKGMPDVRQSLKRSNFQLTYLVKIYDLCRVQGIHLVLLNTPVSPEFYPLQGVSKKSCVSFMRDIRSQFLPQAEYLDFTDYSMTPESYCDVEHLNGKGAIVLSRKVYNLIGIDSLSVKDRHNP